MEDPSKGKKTYAGNICVRSWEKTQHPPRIEQPQRHTAVLRMLLQHEASDQKTRNYKENSHPELRVVPNSQIYVEESTRSAKMSQKNERDRYGPKPIE